jgi:glyceraldehyde 3-phosphate dehydrogenase
MRIAINGFGRIGKNFLRTILQDLHASKKIEVVAINIGPSDKKLIAHLFKYDTLMGTYPGKVSLDGDFLVVDAIKIAVLDQANAELLPWKKLGIDWVVDCSGHYTKREKAEQHIKAGAKKVLISAPAQGDDVTIIPGVNFQAYDAAKHTIVSLGSCTTNAFLPMLSVLDKNFTLKKIFMVTTHAYTNTQALLDVDMGDARRSRAAALNIVPSTTGATSTVGKVLSHLASLVQGISIRVPVAKVSLLDITFEAQKEVSIDSINNAFEQASKTVPLRGILTTTKEELVSSDFNGNPHSVIVDETLTQAMGSTGKVFGWYDNEWGYSERMKDFLSSI